MTEYVKNPDCQDCDDDLRPVGGFAKDIAEGMRL